MTITCLNIPFLSQISKKIIFLHSSGVHIVIYMIYITEGLEIWSIISYSKIIHLPQGTQPYFPGLLISALEVITSYLEPCSLLQNSDVSIRSNRLVLIVVTISSLFYILIFFICFLLPLIFSPSS